jgi:hypothetical protein
MPMKNKIVTLGLLIVGTLFSGLSQAAWYEVEGSATIVSSDSTARIHALNDAIYSAMAYAGADIGTISMLQPFIEENRDQYQFTNHEIRYINVVDEQTKGGKKVLLVRFDIYPSAKGCQVDQYKKTFLVGEFDIHARQQAVMGKIYELGHDFSSIVSRQLDQDSMSFVSVGNTRYPVNNDDPAMLKMLAQDTNAQYLIGGEITDLTATITQRTFGDDIINRQFALEIKVYDGKTGHEIFTRNYRQIANWPFAKTSQVDTKSGRFWASPYGEMLLRVSRQIMLDLETELSCKITLPEVVRVYNDTVTMDLGRIHGVEVGDTLQLWHTGAFIDQGGSPRSKVTKSNISLTVTRVYDQEAELRVEQPELTNSIQIGDVMHKQMDY